MTFRRSVRPRASEIATWKLVPMTIMLILDKFAWRSPQTMNAKGGSATQKQLGSIVLVE